MQGKLSGADTALARWLVFCHTHCDLPLDYRVFKPILEKLCYALDHNLLMADEEAKFAEVALVFVNHCVEFIRKHRHFLASDPEYITQLEAILQCLQLVQVRSEYFSTYFRPLPLIFSTSTPLWPRKG